MQIYIVKYDKEGKEYKKVVLKMVNEFNQETHWYSGFLKEVEFKSWGKGWLEGTATIYPDEDRKPNKK